MNAKTGRAGWAGVVVGWMVACFVSTAVAQEDIVTFVTRLGVDTLAMERIAISGSVVEAEVVTRSPRTVYTWYRLERAGAESFRRLEARETDPITGAVTSLTVYSRDGDSVRIQQVRGERGSAQTIAAAADALPFIDVVHWPFDLMLRRMRERGESTWNAPMITRNRVSEFPLAFIGVDSAMVTHPTRGTMRLSVYPDGGIRTLDAGATTRALIVTEGGEADIGSLAQEFARRDKMGRGVGALSGRDTTRAIVRGAEIQVEFGTPEKRGREIWGKLVKYGVVWRTGANRATHVTTSKPLRFGSVAVAAGEYTLFSVPEADGGVLIINGQTGQNGQQYDKARDVCRVTMHARALADEVEVFSIRVDEAAGGGVLRLQWDRREYVVAFEVIQ